MFTKQGSEELAMRTETENGIEYRIVDFEGKIPGGEGIEFLYAEKTWSIEYRLTSAVRITYTFDGQKQDDALVLDVSQGTFIYDQMQQFWDQPARLAFIQESAQPIMGFLDQAGMWNGELEGL